MTKLALFNDTSYGMHFGCDAVIATILALTEKRGARLIHRHPVGQPWEESEDAHRSIASADAIIVNGEGTIHHSSKKARQLARLGRYCRDRDKKCFLINATIQANDEELLADLQAFSHIWVRESSSQHELESVGIESTLCGDLSLYNSLKAGRATELRPLVLDSVRREANRRLEQIAKQIGGEIISMKYTQAGGLAYPRRHFLKALLNRGPKPTASLPDLKNFHDFANYMGQFNYLVTGRFHGFCFGLILGIPMSIISSNTWKSEAMLSDIGLNPARLIDGRHAPTLIPLADEESSRINDYLHTTRTNIESMFSRVLEGD